jgi:hypothetical protein
MAPLNLPDQDEDETDEEGDEVDNLNFIFNYQFD